MIWITSITFDQVGISFLICYAIREMLIILLPDDLAGPNGSFIRTNEQ